MTTRNPKAADISAFPQVIPDGGFAAQDGMTLRDWFAGQALAGLLGGRTQGARFTPDEVARHAYTVARAMLEERVKAQQGA